MRQPPFQGLLDSAFLGSETGAEEHGRRHVNGNTCHFQVEEEEEEGLHRNPKSQIDQMCNLAVSDSLLTDHF